MNKTLCYNFTDYNPDWPTDKPWSNTITVIMTIMISAVMICNIFGNFLVIAVIARHKGMQTRTNLFLLNLAIADFMVGLLVAPFSLATILKGEWIFGEVVCNVSGFMNAFCYVTSIHTLMYISIHKYFSITRPFSRFVTVARIRIMMAAAWIWAAFIATMTITGLSRVCYKYGTSQCGPVYPHSMKTYTHHIIVQVTVIFIPLCVLCFTYASMYREIQAHTKRLQQNTRLREDTILAQQKKVFFTLFIVLACFVLCWLPYHIYSMYVTINKEGHFNTLFNPVAYFFAYMNSACNPIIYALRSPAFRQGYKQILCWEKSPVFSDDLQVLRRGTLTADSKQNIPEAIRLEETPKEVLRLLTERSFSVPSKLTETIHPGKPLIADTIPEESLSVFQFLNSLRGSKSSSRNIRQGSVVSIQSITSNHSAASRSLPKMSLPTMKGNSVIKKDGSVVIMKDGKIVCVRQDVGNKKSVDSPLFADDKRPSLPNISGYPGGGMLRRENSLPDNVYVVDESGSSWLNNVADHGPNMDNIFEFGIIEEEESVLDEIEMELDDKNGSNESDLERKQEDDDPSRNSRLEQSDSSREESSQFRISPKRNGSLGSVPQADDLAEENKDTLDNNHLPDLRLSLLGDNSSELKTSNGHFRGQEKL